MSLPKNAMLAKNHVIVAIVAQYSEDKNWRRDRVKANVELKLFC